MSDEQLESMLHEEVGSCDPTSFLCLCIRGIDNHLKYFENTKEIHLRCLTTMRELEVVMHMSWTSWKKWGVVLMLTLAGSPVASAAAFGSAEALQKSPAGYKVALPPTVKELSHLDFAAYTPSGARVYRYVPLTRTVAFLGFISSQRLADLTAFAAVGTGNVWITIAPEAPPGPTPTPPGGGDPFLVTKESLQSAMTVLRPKEPITQLFKVGVLPKGYSF